MAEPRSLLTERETARTEVSSWYKYEVVLESTRLKIQVDCAPADMFAMLGARSDI